MRGALAVAVAAEFAWPEVGKHRSKAARPLARQRVVRVPKYPPLPDNVGRRTTWRTIRGERRSFEIVGEIIRAQSNAPHKAICLQRIRSDDDGRIEFRLGYYMIGVQPRMAGKWTWGQFATLLPAADFRWIMRAATRRGWL
jgi:hypothetical protein